MAVRIYQLAKDLKLDNKVLVDICTNAGVTGKGSALASLTDEEVERVKAFMARGSGSTSRAARAAGAAVAERPGEPATVRREDYIAPTGTAGRVPTLPEIGRPKSKRDGDVPVPKPAPKPPLGIKLAPLPTAAQPPAEAPSSEPAPQKPDLKLPIEALRASKAGGAKPLQEHLRKAEQKRKDATKDAAARAPGAPPVELLLGRGEKARKSPLELPGAGRDKGKRGRTEAASGEKSLLGGREHRQLNRKRGDGRRRDEDDGGAARRSLTRRRAGSAAVSPRKGKITLEVPCSVRHFSEVCGVPAQQILRQLMNLGLMTTITASIEADTAELLAGELGLELELKRPIDFAEQRLQEVIGQPDDEAHLAPRAPVITFLGHVDHGKTSLLDRIIGIDVASGESGGITQHIRAYLISKDGRKIAFVDTPGHEAFTEMRARGAHVTDIAVLVVAADDGVMPQTEEAISHARAAGVPIVVALNKIDLPGIDIDRIYQQLATAGLLPTQWGGDTEVVHTSAVTGAGIDALLETLLTMAELHEWKANPDRAAYGTCLEAELHEGRGVVAKFIVQNGTLKVGDAVVCGNAYGRVKAMYETLGARQTRQAAGPSTPVNMTGLDVAPAAGERFYVVGDVATARQIAEQRSQQSRLASFAAPRQHVTLENLFDRLGQEEVQTLHMILRADTRGSIEAIQKELTKLEHPEVKVRVLQATVGGITEADVHLADASDAIIIGFNVVPDENARVLAERKGVQVRRYEIIYKLTEDLQAALEGMLKPEEKEVELGRVLVKRLFVISRVGTIAGCQVLSGVVQRSARVRLIRDSRIIGDYAIDSLKREKDDAREVRQGFECGIKLAGFNDLKEGDLFEAYKVEEVARTLSAAARE